VFADDQCCAAPFSAEPEALKESQSYEQHWGPHADLIVGREAAHQEGRKTYDCQAYLEKRLPPIFVAEVAKDKATDRACQKPNAVQSERRDDAISSVACLPEELSPKYQRRGASIQKKLVPLGHRTHHRGSHDSAQALVGG
jgi:hypothetical protein